MSSATIHESFRRRKKKTDESCSEYIYAMCEIGKKRHVDEESLCEYIVQGIDDDPMIKTCLIAAKTIKQLKSQMRTYDKLAEQNREQRSKRQIPANPLGRNRLYTLPLATPALHMRAIMRHTRTLPYVSTPEHSNR